MMSPDAALHPYQYVLSDHGQAADDGAARVYLTSHISVYIYHLHNARPTWVNNVSDTRRIIDGISTVQHSAIMLNDEITAIGRAVISIRELQINSVNLYSATLRFNVVDTISEMKSHRGFYRLNNTFLENRPDTMPFRQNISYTGEAWVPQVAQVSASERAARRVATNLRDLPYVVYVGLVEARPSPELVVVIDAEPFDQASRYRVYDAYYAVIDADPNILLGLRLQNSRESGIDARQNAALQSRLTLLHRQPT